jgi:hypothetical protein
MVRFYPECRRARRTVTCLCRCGASAPLFSPIRRIPAKSGSSFLSFFGNLPTFQPFKFQTIPRSIPFRITSFADPHPLTLIESHLYKKQGRGVGAPQPCFQLSPKHLRDSRQRPQTQYFHPFTSRFSGYPGVGHLSFSARLRGFCVSALSFSAPQFSLLLDAGGPQ